MRIYFLNPPIMKGGLFMKEVGRCGRKAVAGELWPQTGLATLAAVALEEKCEVALDDAMASGLAVEDLQKILDDFKPDFVIANTTTPTFRNDAAVLELLKKEHDAVYSFTGTHVSALPGESLQESCADLIFINEAEGTLRESIHKWKNWSDVPGIAYKKNGGIVVNSHCPYLPDLDELPFPARHLLPNDRYKMPFFENEPYVTVIPTRGCPWKCTFCRAGKVWGTKVRARSPENVVAEIREVRDELGIRNVVFMTDSLTLDKKWANDFFDAIREAGLEFRWICNSRVDAVTPDMLRKMRETGCILVSYGLESGSQEILDASKKKITLEDSRRAVRWTREAGIISMAYFIVGLPGETHDTIEASIRFAIELEPDYVNFHVATPFPGTELFEIAREHGWLETTDWTRFEEEGSAVLHTDSLTAEDLVRAQKRAMRRFYIRPKRLLKELFRIRSFGQLAARIKAGCSIFSTLAKKE